MRSVSPVVVAIGGVGLVLVWSGLHGATVTATLKDLLAGRAAPTPDTDPLLLGRILPTGTPGGGAEIRFSSSAAGNRANGQLQAAGRGWSGAQWTALDKLWTRESGWNNLAQNPHSSAYGIAQFLDSTWSAYGPKTSDPTLQIRYGLAYIADRYATPAAAWAHEQAQGWY